MVSGSAAMGKPKKTSRKVDVSCNTANAVVATNVSNACYISLGYDKPVACICSSCLFSNRRLNVYCVSASTTRYPQQAAAFEDDKISLGGDDEIQSLRAANHGFKREIPTTHFEISSQKKFGNVSTEWAITQGNKSIEAKTQCSENENRGF